MEIWDAYLSDDTLAGQDLVRGEPIPAGLYHLVCSVLVRHVDGDYLVMQRDPNKQPYPGAYEATAGGSAVKGETPLACIKRELQEETGIAQGNFYQLGRFISDVKHTIYYTFLCETDWDKAAITLQQGETVASYWLSEAEFIAFIQSNDMMNTYKERYSEYFIQKGYLQQEI